MAPGPRNGGVAAWRVLSALWFLAATGGCTKVLEAPPPPPAEPEAVAPARPAPAPAAVRRPWPAEPRAAPPATPDAARVTTIETLNGDPNGLKREDLNSALQGALPGLAGCFQGEGAGPPVVGLSFDADGGGKAQNVKVTGASREAGRCVSAALAAVKLPTFEGKPVPVQFPLSVYRQPPPPPPRPVPAEPAANPSGPATAGGTAAAAGGPSPAGAPPNVFVKP